MHNQWIINLVIISENKKNIIELFSQPEITMIVTWKLEK